MTALQTIAVAFAMFSALPMPQFAWNEKNMRYSLCAFPLVGVLCGVLVLAAGVALWRYHRVAVKQFGGITGDLAGWFLQKAELYMLAALVLCQWKGFL